MTTPTCSTCPSTENLRVVRPRVACTASTFAAPVIRCRACCSKTRGMFKLTRMTVQDYLARSRT